jgi:hypothetical protein
MRRIRRCRFQSQSDRFGDFVIPDPPRRTAAWLVVQPVDPLGGKALTPFADRLLVGSDLLRNGLILLPIRRCEHDARASRHALRRTPPVRQTLQRASFRPSQFNRNRSLAHRSPPIRKL